MSKKKLIIVMIIVAIIGLGARIVRYKYLQKSGKRTSTCGVLNIKEPMVENDAIICNF